MKKVAARPRNISPPTNDLLKEILDSFVINSEDSSSSSGILGSALRESVALELGTTGDNSVLSEDKFIVTNLIKIGSE
jgi:hypothetical protein